ncbi:MAG TPA: ATP-binding protein, partial [Sphingobacteriaceae bacterium]
MLIVSSFYLLPLRFAFIYSFLAILPTIIISIFPQPLPSGVITAEKLASPAFEIIVILNFMTILVGHYLFRQSYISNLEEKEMLNLQLVEAVKEAREAAQSKSDFLSTMSHELRTPLNSVIAISEMLLENISAREKEENLQVLKNSATGLHSLINNILDFNKLGSEKVELEFIPVDQGKLLTEICQGLRFQAAQKGLEFVVDIDERITGLRVLCDPTRLTQIIYNLCGNAVKFTHEGRVTVSLNVLSVDDKTIQVRFAVKDTGIGIGADQLEAIFEPFKQANASTTRNFGGTGLGLAIIKRLLDLFDSTIKVESSPGSGSEFSFDLSLKMALLEENPSELSAEGVDLSGMRILVAEDNHMNRVVLSKVLSRWQISPAFAQNGREAVERLTVEDFDMILMDLHMPEMDGYQATALIRKMTDPAKAQIRILALSASASDDLNQKIEAAGMDGFILKPFKIDELYKRLTAEALKISVINTPD